MVVNGWTLLFHSAMTRQVRAIAVPALKALRFDPEGAASNAHVKMLAAVAKLVLEIVPQDPSRREYRQGNTLGNEYQHWFRAKFFQRFRLFFRYHSKSRIIVFAWVNGLDTQRQAGSRNDPYEVFRAMLRRGNPPDGWTELVKDSAAFPGDLMDALAALGRDDERVAAQPPRPIAAPKVSSPQPRSRRKQKRKDD